MNDFNVLIEKIYWTLGLGLGTYVAVSIAKLNERVAVVIEKTSSHDKRLDNHDEELKQLRIRK